ncbi:1-acyl-sn-glycerol-3-phosphate acyltransferase [Paludibacter jiangxiensis]|uniref:Acyltransferase n=1 Tax=Paludibacter jiangxiensis TaxID=681398 RepID=A0A170YM20_9BACT|nr:1-acyl-sn-glycerol-3-phosphate acyltransferase [Paludibacter jiangxiensis]GAT61903.1 acyltransferase [Paludibacter jiangxiensis]
MENHPEQFDDICPLHSNQVPEAVKSLLSEPNFVGVLQYLFPQIPLEKVIALFQSVQTVDDFQRKIDYPFLKQLEAKTSKGIDLEGAEKLDRSINHLFISNHRDIVLDSAFLCVELIDAGFDTVEIAIGDNLLIYPWIETLVRLNKSFVVRRGVSGRGQLQASQHLSHYMRYALSDKHQSIWLAQREGRAKDGNDRTQESLLKMLNMSGEGSITDNLSSLNICPLTISYEYDPCDYLKAKEFQQKRDNPEYKKSPADDLLNMQTGIMGYKGKIVYRLAGNIADRIKAMPALPRGEQFAAVAQLIDSLIHSNYEIYDNNRIAYDQLNPDKKTGGYTPEAEAAFLKYIDERIAKIDLPDKDEHFLRFKLFEMYANPLVNQLEALQKK